MKVSGLLLVAACGAVFLLSGCGNCKVSSVNNLAPAAAGSTLAGNWLIAGSMPSASPGGSAATEHLRLALTFDATGNTVTAGGFGNHVCAGSTSSFAFGSALTGTVAADETFTLQSPTVSTLQTLSITGKVPGSVGESWLGDYTVSFGTPQGFPYGCVETLSSSFNATYFPLVSGAYTGTAKSTTIVNGVATTTTLFMELSLQQGGTRTDSITGKTITSNTVLNGTIKVQGSPCFSTGATSGPSPSWVLGSEVQATFVIDDEIAT